VYNHHPLRDKQEYGGFVKILAVPPTGVKQHNQPGFTYPKVDGIYPVLKTLKDGTSVGNLLTIIALFEPYYNEFCLRTTNPNGTSDYGGYKYQFVREDGTPLPIEHRHYSWWRRIFSR